MRRAAAVIFLVAAAASGQITSRSRVVASSSTNPLVAEGDQAYSRRQEGRTGLRAGPGPIRQAIAAYERATEDPDFVEARWKLARALYFQGRYTGLDDEGRRAVFVKARRVSEDAIHILGRSLEDRGIKGFFELGPEALAGNLKDRSDAAPTYYWAAACWGQWALSVGKLEAVKTGAADKIREYGLTVIGIDPKFEEGGGYRIVGRLNDQAPWIPFLTAWVSRADALKYLRLAMGISDRNFFNRHFLAEALYHDGDEAESAEAVALEEGLLKDSPSPQTLIEDLTIQQEARKNLEAWKKAS
jgi:tetratricopeptide (TPR) repeat protein